MDAARASVDGRLSNLAAFEESSGLALRNFRLLRAFPSSMGRDRFQGGPLAAIATCLLLIGVPTVAEAAPRSLAVGKAVTLENPVGAVTSGSPVVALDRGGFVRVSAGKVLVNDTTGALRSQWVLSGYSPTSIPYTSVSSSGLVTSLYVATGTVTVYDLSGAILHQWVSQALKSSSSGPGVPSITIDPREPNSLLIVPGAQTDTTYRYSLDGQLQATLPVSTSGPGPSNDNGARIAGDGRIWVGAAGTITGYTPQGRFGWQIGRSCGDCMAAGPAPGIGAPAAVSAPTFAVLRSGEILTPSTTGAAQVFASSGRLLFSCATTRLPRFATLITSGPGKGTTYFSDGVTVVRAVISSKRRAGCTAAPVTITRFSAARSHGTSAARLTFRINRRANVVLVVNAAGCPRVTLGGCAGSALLPLGTLAAGTRSAEIDRCRTSTSTRCLPDGTWDLQVKADGLARPAPHADSPVARLTVS